MNLRFQVLRDLNETLGDAVMSRVTELETRFVQLADELAAAEAGVGEGEEDEGFVDEAVVSELRSQLEAVSEELRGELVPRLADFMSRGVASTERLSELTAQLDAALDNDEL